MKRAARKQRERGAWVYLDFADLTAAGFKPDAEPPFYKTRDHKKTRAGGTVNVQLYRHDLPKGTTK